MFFDMIFLQLGKICFPDIIREGKAFKACINLKCSFPYCLENMISVVFNLILSPPCFFKLLKFAPCLNFCRFSNIFIFIANFLAWLKDTKLKGLIAIFSRKSF